MGEKKKVLVVGAGPVGSLAALYAAQRGDDVEIYELRNGQSGSSFWPYLNWAYQTGGRPSGSHDNTAELYQIHQPCPFGTGHQRHA